MRGTLSSVVLATAGLLLVTIGAPAVGAQVEEPAAEQTPAFVGAEACKECHAKHFEAWSSTKHARAINKLSASSREGGRCNRCHVTGTPEMIAAEGATPSLPNVQCEACHGAGQAHVEAAEAGTAETALTQTVTEQTCTVCHNKTSPHYKPFIFRALKGMVHPID